ncbi:MAG TPA: hypothetical protein VL096_04120 [Pirellulaceae bacterium]|nr:hypothetical protein [Pirellulaceae bacterium]
MTQPDLEAEHDEQPIEQAFTNSWWERLVIAGKTLLFSSLLFWVGMMALLSLLPRQRWKIRVRVAAAVALPAAAILAARKYGYTFHTLSLSSEQIELQSPLRKVQLNPLQVDGILGVEGISFQLTELVAWRKLMLVVDGQAHTISFDQQTNAVCYELLRDSCVHAWGVPYGGELEMPAAGPELGADEYADSLAHVQRRFLTITQKALFTGCLLIVGSVVGALAVWNNIGGPRNPGNRILSLGVLAIAGLILVIRAVKQVGVLRRVRNIASRLREAT